MDPNLTTGWAILNKVLSTAQSLGLYMLLDFQTCNDNQIGDDLSGTPINCLGYTMNDWLQDLQTLAKLGLAYSNIFGVDICSEPHGISWSTWKGLAEPGVSAAYQVNQGIVSFIEGINGNVSEDGAGTNWGENLYYAGGDPVAPIGIPTNKIVYSQHVYDVGKMIGQMFWIFTRKWTYCYCWRIWL